MCRPLSEPGLAPDRIGIRFGYMLKPRLAYISSYCNYECTVCSDVCPTGAIKPLTIEEKTTTQVGIATFFKGRCVVNTEEKDCGACAEHCPTQAVHMVPYKGTLTIRRSTLISVSDAADANRSVRYAQCVPSSSNRTLSTNSSKSLKKRKSKKLR